MCDSVNHTRFPKEDHVPDSVCRDKHGNKGGRVQAITDKSGTVQNKSVETVAIDGNCGIYTLNCQCVFNQLLVVYGGYGQTRTLD